MNTSKPAAWEIEHCWQWYGESLQGTEQQLKRLGIAPYAAYPLEEGATLHCTDPRGLPCEILASVCDKGTYIVRIKYPGRTKPWDRPQIEYAEGVLLEEGCSFDSYVGPRDALIQAGLARIDQFPGPDAVRKNKIDISPDGHPWGGTRYAKSPAIFQEPGAKTITRKGNKFKIQLYLPHEEREQRQADYQQKLRLWESDRPFPSLFEIAEKRSHLSVVKSAHPLCNASMPSDLPRTQPHLSLVHSVLRSPS